MNGSMCQVDDGTAPDAPFTLVDALPTIRGTQVSAVRSFTMMKTAYRRAQSREVCTLRDPRVAFP